MYISPFITTRKDKEKLPYVYISLHYNTEGRGKVAVCIYHNFIITRKDKTKLRYVYISLPYNKED